MQHHSWHRALKGHAYCHWELAGHPASSVASERLGQYSRLTNYICQDLAHATQLELIKQHCCCTPPVVPLLSTYCSVQEKHGICFTQTVTVYHLYQHSVHYYRYTGPDLVVFLTVWLCNSVDNNGCTRSVCVMSVTVHISGTRCTHVAAVNSVPVIRWCNLTRTGHYQNSDPLIWLCIQNHTKLVHTGTVNQQVLAQHNWRMLCAATA